MRFAFFGPVLKQSSKGDYEIVTREFRNALLYILRHNIWSTTLRSSVRWLLRRTETPLNLQRVLRALGNSSNAYDIKSVLDTHLGYPHTGTKVRADYDEEWDTLMMLLLLEREMAVEEAAWTALTKQTFAVNSVVPTKAKSLVPAARVNLLKPDAYEEVDDSGSATEVDFARQIIGLPLCESALFDGDQETYRLH